MATPLKNRQQIRTRLAFIYGSLNADELLDRVEVIAETHREQHQPKSRDTLWDERDVILITYGNSILDDNQKPLSVLNRFCRDHLNDAVSTIHILPFFPYSSDDGFSVINYLKVNPDLGDWEDIHSLGAEFELMFDFVLNHISRESLWFADYLEHMPPGNRYFIEADPNDPALKKVVRPRAQPLMIRVRTRHDERYVWGTFSKDQLDLNYANPDVLMQALGILLFYIREGARIVRLDAVAFLWKELGTNCIHLPQTHEIIKLFRDVLSEIAPDVILLTETNVPHAENISYFGEGDEAHMVYQFSLPPLLLHAIYSGSTQYLSQWLKDLAPAPQACTFLNFTASHDGVGLRALEGIVPDEEITQMLDGMRQRGGFISSRAQADGSETPYELNISYFDAMRDPEPQHDMWHIQRFLLSQTVALSLQGVPAVYIHSLFATPNFQEGVELTGRTRSINRRRWKLDELEAHISLPDSPGQIVFNQLRERLALRRAQAAFHPQASQEIIDAGENLLLVRRTSQASGQSILAAFNFTPLAQTIGLEKIGLQLKGDTCCIDLLSGEAPRLQTNESVSLLIPAYGCYWLEEAADLQGER